MSTTIKFANKLHPVLNASNENSFYSPFSLLSALGMCALGAKFKTKEELTALLGETKEIAEMAKEVSTNKNDAYQLVAANALWVQKDFELCQDFIETIHEDFAGSLAEVDYKANPKGAVNRINAWCDESTRGKITEVIDEGAINKDTRLILTNAIYFKGLWDKAFKKENTVNSKFTSNGSSKSVPTMVQTNNFKYSENDDFESLEMDYQGDDLSMLILLPKRQDTRILEAIDSNLQEAYEAAIGGQRTTEVTVRLPKFKMETEYKLSQKLKELGVVHPFLNEANFSGISTQESLKISEVIHKAFVECDEEGTEAAAVTAVVMVRTCAMVRNIVFNADHPFVFFIRNKNTNEVLFTGRVVNP